MKKDTTDKVPRQGRKPFFARLLETQELEKVAGGRHHGTRKYPSDSDECSVTEKYPSDSDDFVTLKFPSDSDDVSTR